MILLTDIKNTRTGRYFAGGGNEKLWKFSSIWGNLGIFRASLVAQRLNHLPAMWETCVRSLGQEDPLEKEMATHSSILAWRISWMEAPGGLQSMGSQRVGHDWVTSLYTSLGIFKKQLDVKYKEFRTEDIGLPHINNIRHLGTISEVLETKGEKILKSRE